jgi:PLD-like domain
MPGTSIELRVYANVDDATIVWQTGARIPGCRGFALDRRVRDAKGAITSSVLPTWVGFAGETPAQSGEHRDSTEWPVQRFLWSDYSARDAAAVQYRVVPMLGPAGKLKRAPDSACSSWSDWVEVKTGKTPGFFAYFNRGIIAAQWVARLLGDAPGGPVAQLRRDIQDPNAKDRKFLGGLLRGEMLTLLAGVQSEGGEIWAALYELNDPELIPALSALGKKCHLVLGSGAFKSGEPDENAAVRARLKSEKKIDLHDRLVGSPHFAHNKFVVIAGKDGVPNRVWTGSTNWTVTGLCTQVNNGILIESAELAAAYKKRWDALVAAGAGYPPSLAQQGSVPAHVSVGTSTVTAWNAPCVGLVDLADARKLIWGARQGVLFLFFNPGPSGSLLNDVLALKADKLFVHGVVNQDPGGKTPLLTLYDRGTSVNPDPEVVLPAEIKTQMKGWFRDEFRFNMVMIHSKIVVIDPFGPHPVVMTGSHNMGPKASGKNDDNLVIIENAPGLAAEYAVNVLGIYGHFKSRHNAVQAAKAGSGQRAGGKTTPWKGLQDGDTWQDEFLSGEKKKELDFWFGRLGVGPG